MKLVGTLSEDERQRLLEASSSVPFIHYKSHDKDYWAYQSGDELWLKICPGGFVHKHTDKAGVRLQHVVQTNPLAVSYVAGEAFSLTQGGIYELDGRLEHWSVNNGSEDRIHYIELVKILRTAQPFTRT